MTQADERYFILNDAGVASGPFDLISMMRKIHSGKLDGETTVMRESDSTPYRARHMPELAVFYQKALDDNPKHHSLGDGMLDIKRMLISGFEFINIHHNAAVLAGIGVVTLVGLGVMLNSVLPKNIVVMLCVLLFWVLQSLFMVMTLRVNRGQLIDARYIREQLLPSLLPISIGALLLGVLTMGGVLLVIVPGIVIYALYAHTPFFIIEKNMPILQAMKASKQAMFQRQKEPFMISLCLTMIFLVSAALIVPLPLIMPVISAAHAELYDQLHHG